MERKRLVADRFRRIWAVVEHIARYPGLSRRELAAHFSLSERQLQADLEVVRREMGFPLVRQHGYRFLPVQEGAAVPFGLADAYLLARALRQAAADDLAAAEAIRALMTKLPAMFPSHLQPLLRRALGPSALDPAALGTPDLLVVVAQALRDRAAVRLRYRTGPDPGLALEMVVEPELVLPYRGGWYLIGYCRDTRKVGMFALDRLVGASIVVELPAPR